MDHCVPQGAGAAPDVVLGLPVDKLALLLLAKFADESLTLDRHNFLNNADHTYASADVANPGRIVRALAEAFDGLLNKA